MGNSKAKSPQQTTEGNQKQKKDGPQQQHLLSLRHEEPLRRLLLQEQLGRGMDDSQQNPDAPEPIQGVQEHVQQGGDQGGRGRGQDGGGIDASEYKPEELKVSVQSGRLLVEGKHEEKKEDGGAYVQRSFSRSYTLPKEARADQMVSHLSSEGVLLITAPKSAPAITNEAQK